MSKYFRVYIGNTDLVYKIPDELENNDIKSIEVLDPKTNTTDYWLSKV